MEVSLYNQFDQVNVPATVATVNGNVCYLMYLYSAFSMWSIFKCTLQHFVVDFARLLYGVVHNLFNSNTVEFKGAPRTE